MKLAEYIDELSTVNREFSEKGAKCNVVDSGWASFLIATNEVKGIEIYLGSNRERWTVDYFEAEVSIDGERDFDTLSNAITSASNFLFNVT